MPLSRAVEILRPHLHRAGDALRARQDARLHMEGLYGPARRRGDNSRSNTRIDGEASAMIAMFEPYRAIDDDGPSEDDDGALWRQEVGAQARRDQVARRHEDPVGGIIVVFVDQLIRRQRRPADIIVAAAPIDPGRAPFVARNPEPAEPPVMRPATIVKGHPTPVGLFLVGDPVPAPLFGIDPSSVRCRDAIRAADRMAPRLRRSADAAATIHRARARTEIRLRPARAPAPGCNRHRSR